MVRMGVEEADMAATIVVDSLDANLVSEVTVGSEGTQVYQNLQGDLRKKQKSMRNRFFIHIVYGRKESVLWCGFGRGCGKSR